MIWAETLVAGAGPPGVRPCREHKRGTNLTPGA
jgi:hypothetical protein